MSLDKAVIARLQPGEDHFEILIDPQVAASIIEGNDEDVLSSLAIDTLFTGSKKGDHAPQDAFPKF